MRTRSEALPSSVKENIDTFDKFLRGCHAITILLLSRLSDQLGLTGENRFETRHRDSAPSTSTLALFRYPKQDTTDTNSIGHNQHTDIGALTLLLCDQWGLQVFSPELQNWGFIAPRAKHAVVNVGDTLRFLSGNKLSSSIHRVLPLGERQEEHRYSIAYFLRAENDAMLTDPNGQVISAKDWHDKKFDVFRESHEVQAKEPILLGGMENGVPLLVN
jgi:isopenicillin N synthase-like dioxygenase